MVKGTDRTTDTSEPEFSVHTRRRRRRSQSLPRLLRSRASDPSRRGRQECERAIRSSGCLPTSGNGSMWSSARHDQVRNQDLHGLAGLVQRRRPHLDQFLLRSCSRRPNFKDFALKADAVSPSPPAVLPPAVTPSPAGPSMTLGNMRSLAVRYLAVRSPASNQAPGLMFPSARGVAKPRCQMGVR